MAKAPTSTAASDAAPVPVADPAPEGTPAPDTAPVDPVPDEAPIAGATDEVLHLKTTGAFMLMDPFTGRQFDNEKTTETIVTQWVQDQIDAKRLA